MRRRNTRHINQTGNYQMDAQAQDSADLHPDPHNIWGEIPHSMSQPNIHPMMPTSSSFDTHHLPEPYGIYYGMTPHNGFEHHPSLSNHRFIGGPTDDPYKRKNTHFDSLASSSSSNPPINTGHPDFGSMMMVPEFYSQPQYDGALRLQSIMGYSQNQLGHGQYIGAGQRGGPGSIWMDPQSGSGGGEGNGFGWNHAHAVMYFPNNNVNAGPMETGNMSLQGYQISNHRSYSTYQHPPPFLHHHNLHINPNYPPPPQPVPPLMPGAINLNINFPPPSLANSQSFVGTTHRQVGPVPPPGLGMLRPHHGPVETNSRHHNFPYIRVLPGEEVAMLEFSEYYEMRDYVDNLSDMRLDIEDMSYEELLALGDQIGNVNTGLSEETITKLMKIRIYLSPATTINLEELPSMDDEGEVCIICQCNYENKEKIGTLDCGHEYHAKCLNKWLLVKNVCPICKSAALTTKRKAV